MKSNDLNNKRQEVRGLMQKAILAGDQDGFYQAFDDMMELIAQDVRSQYDAQMENMRAEMDSRILTARGVRQLTSDERNYYQKFAAAAASQDPKQALANLDVVLPKTTINSVLEDLATNHPLLSRINFISTDGAIRLIMNENGYQEAAWGPLCDEIVKELTSGFKEVSTNLLKLSAFLPVCKAMLELGPEWLDNYVRQILFEALANGLEAGYVSGDGKDKPIGMDRQVGPDVVVSGGVYPRKASISVSNLAPDTIGNLLSLIAVAPSGKPRKVQDVILICNPQDYFQKVMPATTLMAPDGSYRNDVMPYPMTIVQSPALDRGEAILGLGRRYFAPVGMERNGRIEYSDHYRFLEDERVYLVKLYANGLPMDSNAFLLLDISGLQPATWKVEQVIAPAASANANLSGLTIGGLAISPTFAEGTTSYTASTRNATNSIMAFPADASAEVSVKVNSKMIDNGAAAKWTDGENQVSITVTAADGTEKTYSVTVTKS